MTRGSRWGRGGGHGVGVCVCFQSFGGRGPLVGALGVAEDPDGEVLDVGRPLGGELEELDVVPLHSVDQHCSGTQTDAHKTLFTIDSPVDQNRTYSEERVRKQFVGI